MIRRPYQIEAGDAVHKGWKNHQTGLVVSPTGTGKTEMFIHEISIAREQGLKTIILVDRINLVSQTAKRINRRLNIWPDLEQADMYAVTKGPNAADVVIATIQSLRSGKDRKRYERFNPMHFDRMLIDEAHLTITPSTIETVRYFLDGNPKMRMCGYTATPKRADGLSLGQLYKECFYRYDIRAAIKDGWLVPIMGMVSVVKSFELKPIKGGRDWTANEIAEKAEKEGPLLEMVGTLLRHCENKRTLVFCARVSHAELVAANLNNKRPMCARVIHGGTPEPERKQILAAYENDEFQYLCNCAVLTTGFDSPGIQVVAMCRPTKSWSLFTQCVGRGLRPLTGIVDGLDSPEDRVNAITTSSKPYVEVISFVGRNGAMNLIGPQHVLAGDMAPPEVGEIANELDDGEGELTDTSELLEKAEEEYEERLRYERENAPVEIKVEYGMQRTDLFNKREFQIATESRVDIPSECQCAYLVAAGFKKEKVELWDGEMARRATRLVQDRHADGLCTVKQALWLNRQGYSKVELRVMSKKKASSIMSRRFGGYSRK